jgi:hypothetical protein
MNHMQRSWKLLICLFCLSAAISVLAQSYRGEAVPVIERVDPVELSRMRFLTFVFGHEGPMDTPLTTPPVAGREYFAEADVFGIETAANIQFELVDASGRPLQTLTMWKSSDASDDGEFYGFIAVPAQPFRVAINGSNASGSRFRFVLGDLFRPVASGPSEQPQLPPGIPASTSAQLSGMIESYRQEMHQRAAKAAMDYPDGVIPLPRALMSKISYEPLQSPPIGLRLRYTLQVPRRMTLSAVPHVFPAYPNFEWRGVVTMNPIAGSITPLPAMVGAQSMRDVLVYQGGATYDPGITYAFVVDFVPDYVIQGTQSGRFCLYEQKFTNRAVWESLVASPNAIPYSISNSDTGTAATIPAFLPQRTFYESFKTAGAVDCGPQPNSRF